MKDPAHSDIPYRASELEHRYGGNVHLLAEPYPMSLLARFCGTETTQPEVTWLVRELYGHLLRAALNAEFPRTQRRIDTRMIEHNENGFYEGDVLDASQKAVIVNIARAGYLPGQVLFEIMNHTVDPAGVRFDHIFMNRATNEKGEVVGVNLAGNKIGGPVDDAVVFVPDPMGATGSSLCEALAIYKDQVDGTPKRFLALHLIVTPEYIKRLTTDHPDVVIYALRLDRGMSPADVLDSVPGEHWDRESGLNEMQYIVPGAGGIGEILNNAFV